MAVEILRISQWVLGLLHFDAIRLYLRLTELFFRLLLPRMRPRFLILHLTIVYLPSVLNTNDFFPSLVLQNPTHITINIWVLLRLSVFFLLVITVFFNISFNPILCSSKNLTFIRAWEYFSFSHFTFNGSFSLNSL
jgi:hypothetical protein